MLHEGSHHSHGSMWRSPSRALSTQLESAEAPEPAHAQPEGSRRHPRTVKWYLATFFSGYGNPPPMSRQHREGRSGSRALSAQLCTQAAAARSTLPLPDGTRWLTHRSLTDVAAAAILPAHSPDLPDAQDARRPGYTQQAPAACGHGPGLAGGLRIHTGAVSAESLGHAFHPPAVPRRLLRVRQSQHLWTSTQKCTAGLFSASVNSSRQSVQRSPKGCGGLCKA